MKLKSTKGATLDGLKVLVYGASGVGKTRMIETAKNPIIISSESGLLSLAHTDIPVIEVKSSEDLDDAYNFLKKNEEYDWICLDSLSDIAESILSGYQDRFTDGRQAYGELGKVMARNIRRFRDLKGINVYFTAKEARTEVNNVIISQPSMPGQTLTINVPYFFDEVLRLEANRKGERILHTTSSFTQVCKDRSGKLDAKEDANLQNLLNKIVK